MQVNFNPAFLKQKDSYAFRGNSNVISNKVSTLINTDRLVDSFITLAKIDSGSNEELAEKITPSTDGQKNVAKFLVEKLKELGLEDINVDEHSIVTATLNSNIGEEAPIIGLLAHMDTSPDAPNTNVKPQIQDYKGGDLKLNEGTVISAEDLKAYIGQKVITSDGTTLLGADDKSGIAEILEAINVFKENPELQHPKIKIAFTPDEETGMGVEKFNIKQFGADSAYTVDGDFPYVIENESFNAFNPVIKIKGKSAHCGYAKGKMVNSTSVAVWIKNQLPKNQTPETTSGRQGYFHFDSIHGDIGETTVKMLVRDHDFKRAERRVAFLEKIIEKAKRKFNCEIDFKPREMYGNMGDKIKEFPEVLEYAKEGIKRSGFIPKTVAIRGGTDGSHLSLNGLLTPNLGAAGHNYHSKSEFLPIEEMKKCTENIINIMSVWAEKSKEIMPKILMRR